MGGVNKTTRSVRPASVFESAKAIVGATTTHNQGDLLIFDTSAKVMRPPVSEAEGQYALGIARESLVNGVIPRPYSTAVDASAAIADVPGPQYGIVQKMVLKNGDTLNPGDSVYCYPTQSARAVQASGTKAIGVYQGPTVTGTPSATPTEVEVLIGARYPNDTLKF